MPLHNRYDEGIIDQFSAPVRQVPEWHDHFHQATRSAVASQYLYALVTVTPERRKTIDLRAWRKVFGATTNNGACGPDVRFIGNVGHYTPQSSRVLGRIVHESDIVR